MVHTPSRRRRTVALALLVSLATLCWAAAAHASTTIGTEESSPVGGQCCFGDPNTATYGQTITVPAGQNSLDSFSFFLDVPPGLVFRAYVYAWDGKEATGPALYESADMHTTEEGAYQRITASTGGVAVTPAKQYVLFFSISKDKALDEGSELEGEWQDIEEGNAYAGGSLVWLNNSYRPEEWTSPEVRFEETGPWAILEARDMKFSASFSLAAPSVSSVSPRSVSQGTHVTIVGNHLAEASDVLFGAVPATSFTVISATEITAVAPGGPSGTVDVTVVAPGGTSATGTADQVSYAPAVQTVAAPTAPPTPLSAPPAKCVVPYVGYMTRSEAERALQAAGCTLGEIARHYNKAAKGEVVEQSLHQGTIVPEGSEVNVWLSLGAYKRHQSQHRHRARAKR